jgi:hypothetical protein
VQARYARVAPPQTGAELFGGVRRAPGRARIDRRDPNRPGGILRRFTEFQLPSGGGGQHQPDPARHGIRVDPRPADRRVAGRREAASAGTRTDPNATLMTGFIFFSTRG